MARVILSNHNPQESFEAEVEGDIEWLRRPPPEHVVCLDALWTYRGEVRGGMPVYHRAFALAAKRVPS
jgi:hypothetical protein